MFVAPLAWPQSSVPPRRVRPPRRARPAGTPTTFLLLWLALGLGVLVGVPDARGDALFGATLPFWLVAAPLLDLAWSCRAALLHGLRRLARRERLRPVRRQARRWRSAGALRRAPLPF